MTYSRHLIAFAALLLVLTAPLSAQSVDAIYYNGTILTMAGSTPSYVEAVAIKDGTIAFAGNKDKAFERKGEATKLVDLGGKTL